MLGSNASLGASEVCAGFQDEKKCLEKNPKTADTKEKYNLQAKAFSKAESSKDLFVLTGSLCPSPAFMKHCNLHSLLNKILKLCLFAIEGICKQFVPGNCLSTRLWRI